MKLLSNKIFAVSLAFGIFLDASMAIAGGRFSQLVLAFDEIRGVEFQSNADQNSVTIMFKNTTPSELGALDLYDERLIKRVLVKDLGPLGSEVKLILKDRNVRVSINKHLEPFRVVVDLFDYDYNLESDPKTGLPLVGIGSHQNQVNGSTPQTRFIQNRPNYSTDYQMADPGSGNSRSEYLLDSSDHSNQMVERPTGDSGSKRKLLQPTPDTITSPGQLVQMMQNTKQGRAKFWKQYPSYIYPLQTAAFEGRKESSGWIKSQSSKALTSAQAMAEYAYKLFSFGHEGRALIAYQQVLHKDPSVFAKDALHLWAFSEVHFAHGNSTLAVGYYDTLINRHPESPLAKFAALRKLDNAAIRIIKSGQSEKLTELLAPLSRVNPGNSAELQTQIAIRRAYWNKEGIQKDASAKYLPKINEEVKSALVSSYTNVEGQRTAFLASSILLKYMTDTSRPWSASYGDFANQYFKRFRGSSAEPHISELKDALKTRLAAIIVNHSANKNYSAAVQSFEALPKPLQSVRKDEKVAWALAEAYRNEGLYSSSLPLYKQAAKTVEAGPKKFQANFWTGVTADLVAERMKNEGNKSRLNSLRTLMRKSDKQMERSWKSLTEDEKATLATAYKDHFEKVVMSNSRLRTPPQIVLESWTNGLSSRLNGTNGSGGAAATQWDKNFSPTSSSIYLLNSLAKRFKETGQKAKRRETVRVMQAIKPSEFANDKKARKIWNDELLSLADDYRKANDYLEAGRLYTFAATNSPDVDNRAETLYKGGLLLYRSGHRDEAIKAFTSASEDGNNLFYANLSKERLSQLQK